MGKKLRFGLFGNGVCCRSAGFAKSIYQSGAEVVAFCDARESTFDDIRKTVKELGGEVTCYTDFDEFIKGDFDAVILCNYFCEHAPFAMKAMRAGKHVLSECTSNITMAEGVALCRCVEETGKTYALLENYPGSKTNMEMERLYKAGSLGKLVYGEGAYVHPMSPDEYKWLAPGVYHWRNWTPRSYYLTHALCPVLQMTDTLPVRVTGYASFAPEIAEDTGLRTGDAAVIVMCQTDNDAVLRVTGWANYAPHGNDYKLCCTKGGVYATGDDVHVRYLDWCRPEGVESEALDYAPEWPLKELGDAADAAGHGGGDFWAVYFFIKDLENGTEPYWNVYRATAVASTAILAWRSVLCGNMPFDVPNFRKEEDKRKYENDFVSPYPDENGKPDIPCSSHPYAPKDEWIEKIRAQYPDKPYIQNKN